MDQTKGQCVIYSDHVIVLYTIQLIEPLSQALYEGVSRIIVCGMVLTLKLFFFGYRSLLSSVYVPPLSSTFDVRQIKSPILWRTEEGLCHTAAEKLLVEDDDDYPSASPRPGCC